MRNYLKVLASPVICVALMAMASRPAVLPADFEPRPAEYACPAPSQFVPEVTDLSKNWANSELRRGEYYRSNGGTVVANIGVYDMPLTSTARALLNDPGTFDGALVGIPFSDTSELANAARTAGAVNAKARVFDIRARHAYRWERHAPCMSRTAFLALKATADKAFLDAATAAGNFQTAMYRYEQSRGGAGVITR
jgi:hypothetical protein